MALKLPLVLDASGQVEQLQAGDLLSSSIISGGGSAQASPQAVTTGNTFTVPLNQQCVCIEDVVVDDTIVCDGTLVLTR